MSTTVAEPINIGIAEPIRTNPELMRAVEAANRFFESLIEKKKLYDAHRELVWGSSDPLEPDCHITLLATESDQYGDRDSSRMTSVKRLLDPVARNALVSDVYLDILGKRWHQANVRIVAELRELEDEELKNANDR